MTRDAGAPGVWRVARPQLCALACIAVLAAFALACARLAPAPAIDGEASDRAAIDAADLALARGELADARSGYTEVVERSPGDARAWSGLARVEWAEGDLAAAVAADDLARAARTERPNPRALGDRERCALWLAAALEDTGADAPARLDAAAALLARIDGAPACEHVDAARLRGELAWRRAERAHEAGDLDAALRAATEALGHDATRVGVERRVGRWLLEAERRRDALVWLGDALARHPDDAALRQLMLEALGVPGLAP